MTMKCHIYSSEKNKLGTKANHSVILSVYIISAYMTHDNEVSLIYTVETEQSHFDLLS